MKLKTTNDIVLIIKDGRLIVDQFVKHEQKSIKEELVPLLIFLSKEKTIEELYVFLQENEYEIKKFSAIINKLIETGIIEKITGEKKPDPFDSWGTPVKYFHFNTRTVLTDTFRSAVDEFEKLSNEKEPMPNIFKDVDHIEEIHLPFPNMIKSGFSEVALNRQTIRSFDIEESINIDELSTILYHVFGATATSLDHGIGKSLFKISPSGGGRHSIEAYPVVFNVSGVNNGIYHYSVENHSLKLIEKGDFREWMVEASGEQHHTSWPSVSIIYVSQLKRMEWKYKSARGYKAVYMDLGHLSQTMYLSAAAMNLGCFYAGAMKEEMVEQKLKLNMLEEMPIGVSGIGKLKRNVQLEGRYVRDDVTILHEG